MRRPILGRPAHPSQSTRACRAPRATGEVRQSRLAVRALAAIFVPTVGCASLVACQARPADAPTVENETPTSSPTTPVQSKEEAEKLRNLIIGVDAFNGNLNPHMVGNTGTVASAVADLTLPSAFVRRADQWVRNKDLLRSAIPDDPAAPRTVRYRIDPAAQWSDGTPVSGSDFQYLSDVIKQQQTAEESHIYSLIDSIKVSAGGQEIKVTFSRPNPGWRQLFRHLLPSHIYRSEAQDFLTMMDGRSAASAGAYVVRSVDAGRGVVELQRNDRYWGDHPAMTDKLTLTAVPDLQTGAQMLRSGQIQMYVTRPGTVTELTMQQIPGVRGIARDREVQLTLNANQASQVMAEASTRRAVFANVDRRIIAQIVSGDPKVELPEWGSPVIDDADATAAGSQPSDRASLRALQQRSAQEPLIVAAPAEESTAIGAARVAADQLNNAGISAQVRTMDSTELFDHAIPQGSVDLTVAWTRVPTSRADFANQFHCVGEHPAQAAPEGSTDAAATSTAAAAAASPDTSANSAAPSAPGTPGAAGITAAEGSPRAGEEKAAEERTGEGETESSRQDSATGSTFGGNITGSCDPKLDKLLDDGRDATNSRPAEADLDQLISLVQQQALVLPLVKDRQFVAINQELSGPKRGMVTWPFDPFSGIFVDGASWSRREIPTQPRPQ